MEHEVAALGPGTWGETLADFRARYTGPEERFYGVRLSTWAWIGKAPIESDGWAVARWIQGHCCYTDGPHAREPIVLRNWQLAEIIEMFRLHKGRRLYRRGLLGVPRKNGKSMIGAGLALQGLLGDGEYGAQVYSCAGDRDQAKIVYREAVSMIQLSPALSKRLKVRESSSIITDEETRSIYKALSAEAYTKEGLNPSRVIFDEVHVQPNDDLWNVMTMGSATRRQPFILGITTAGYDKSSLCGRMYDAGREQEAKLASAELDTPLVYFQWYEAPRTRGGVELPWDDVETARLCNPAFEDFLDPEVIVSLEYPNGENAVRRYRLNQWTSAVDRWIPQGEWEALATVRRLVKTEMKDGHLIEGEDCVLALDGSFNNDSTAVVACTRDGFLQVLGAWEKPDKADEWRVSVGEVMDCIRQAYKDYFVHEVAYDPYRWEMVAQALRDEGIKMVEYPQTTERLTPATTEFYDAVVRDRSISHDGSPVLARHVENCRIRETPRGNRIEKESKSSPNKIDAAVAAVMAHSRAKMLPETSSNVW